MLGRNNFAVIVNRTYLFRHMYLHSSLQLNGLHNVILGEGGVTLLIFKIMNNSISLPIVSSVRKDWSLKCILST